MRTSAVHPAPCEALGEMGKRHDLLKAVSESEGLGSLKDLGLSLTLLLPS